METKNKSLFLWVAIGVMTIGIMLFGLVTYYSYTDQAVDEDREVLSSAAKEERTQIMKDLGLDEQVLLADASTDESTDTDDSEDAGVIIGKDGKDNATDSKPKTTASTNGNYKEADMSKATEKKKDTKASEKEDAAAEKSNGSAELNVPTQRDLAEFQKSDEYKKIFDKRKDIISIPSVNTYLPLYSKLDNPHLNVGVSTYNGAFDATKTNNIILGHNIEVADKLFSNLPNVKKGEKIFVYKDKLKYTYYVTSIEVVEYNKSTALTKKYEYGNQLTLITCYGASKDKNKRVVVHASAEIEN